MSLFLVEISFIPGTYIKGGAQSIAQETITETLGSTGKKFKVIGDNKFIAVVESEDAANDLQAKIYEATLNTAVMKSTPIRNEENFNEHVLKINPDLCVVKREPFSTTKKIFVSRITIGHPGYNLQELFEVWKVEAEGSLTARANGKLEYWSFKVIGERVIYVFWAADSGDEADNIVQTLPTVTSRITGNDYVFHDTAQVEPF